MRAKTPPIATASGPHVGGVSLARRTGRANKRPPANKVAITIANTSNSALIRAKQEE